MKPRFYYCGTLAMLAPVEREGFSRASRFQLAESLSTIFDFPL